MGNKDLFNKEMTESSGWFKATECRVLSWLINGWISRHINDYMLHIILYKYKL